MGIKVSVIVAVYNSENYLRQMLNSVLNQTLKEIEIICVDDGSTDTSLEILREYEMKYSNVKVLQQPEKSDGAALARNLGMEYASGEYLSILDSDDFFELNMLEKAYSRAKSTNAEIVIYDGYVFDEKLKTDKEVGYILHREYLKDGEDLLETENYSEVLFQLTLGAAWNCLFRHDFVKENKLQFQSFHHADDLGFVYTAFACAKQIAVLRERLLHYRLNNSSSQAANIAQWPETSYYSLENLKNELIRTSKYEKFKISFIQEVMIYVDFYIEGMKDYQILETLYNTLKNEYFEKLDVFDIADEQFRNEYFSKLRYCIKNMSCGEYLYTKYNNLFPFSNGNPQKMEVWRTKLDANEKIILYGAGNIGTNLFCELLQNKKRNLVAWCDKNYSKIGYPVVSPDAIAKLEYDCIVVAVLDEGLYQVIKQELLFRGVSEKNIYWVGETQDEE